MKHKCDTCQYKGEHQEMGFKPSGVCTKEHNLLKAMLAYRAPECPFSVKEETKEETPREKLVEILEGLVIVEAYGVYLSKREIYGQIADQLIAHGVTVKEPQKPLTVEELTRLPKVVYIECTFFVEIHAALPDRLCGTPPCLGIQFVGAYEKFKLDKYGKTWRCWVEKPTEEERKAAKWEK